MNQRQIKARFKKIEKKQEKWAEAEAALQKLCAHPNYTEKHDGNTGNYDPSADSYWIEYRCHDCDKRWTVYQ